MQRERTGGAPSRTQRNYTRRIGRLWDEDGKPLKQGQAYRRNLSVDELSEKYEQDLESLSAEEMIVEWGVDRPRFLGTEPGDRISSVHLRSPMYTDLENGFELTPKKLGSTKTWFLRAPKSLILRARRATADGAQYEARGLQWPAPGEKMTLRRVYVQDRQAIGDLVVVVRDIFPSDLVGSARIKFESSVDSRRLTESRRGIRRTAASAAQ